MTYKPKQEAYLTFMKAGEDYCSSEVSQAESNGQKLRVAFYTIEPFLEQTTRKNSSAK